MVDSTTPAAVCRTSAAPDGTRRRGPCHQHCSPSACTVRHPQPHDIRLTRAAESTISARHDRDVDRRLKLTGIAAGYTTCPTEQGTRRGGGRPAARRAPPVERRAPPADVAGR